MPVYKAKAIVQLRPSVLDPAGEATRAAAKRLGIEGITKLRIGKYVELEINASNESDANRDLTALSEKLLANPVIENWSFDIESLTTKN